VQKFLRLTRKFLKHAVFWDIKDQFLPHRKHITSSLQTPVYISLYKIWGFPGGDYEECCLLGCDAVWLLLEPTFHYFFAGYFSCWFLLTLFLPCRFLLPWWWRRHFHPKRPILLEPHGLTPQKTTFFIVTAMKASNPARKFLSSWEPVSGLIGHDGPC
jgi:hypothetical protein